MRKPRGGRARVSGQALVEYAFLIVLVITILIGVMTLAGTQLEVAFNDVKWDLSQLGNDAVTVAPHTCADGTAAVFRHGKYRCSNE